MHAVAVYVGSPAYNCAQHALLLNLYQVSMQNIGLSCVAVHAVHTCYLELLVKTKVLRQTLTNTHVWFGRAVAAWHCVPCTSALMCVRTGHYQTSLMCPDHAKYI